MLKAVAGGGGGGGLTIGTTTITGGADTQVLFNDVGTVGSDAGLTYNKTIGQAKAIRFVADAQLNSAVSILGVINTSGEYTFASSFGVGGVAQGAVLASGSVISWDTTTNALNGAPDLFLRRDAANTLAQRNGTAGQVLRVYNTWTDASNGQWASMRWVAGQLYIGTEANGSGAGAPIYIQSSSSITFQVGGANSIWTMSGNGHLLAGIDNTFDIGAAGATRPRVIYAGTRIQTPASVTGGAGINLPSGTAPTSPVDGDIWYDGTNLKVRLAGATKTITAV